MYRVTCDGLPIYDLRSDLQLVLVSPKLTLEDSAAGSFDFTILPTHPYYENVKRMVSEIIVYRDDEEIFSGRITEETGDFYKRRTLHCEGELGYLNDTRQDPAEYHDMTVRGFLTTLVDIHNAKVGADKQFTVGVVTVTDSNDSLYRYTNFETTLTCINDKLIGSLGGHIRIRKVDGVRYIDYLADTARTNTQVIRFGENLMDFAKSYDSNDFVTVVIPLGARQDESEIEALDAYLTVESVNDGKNYIVNETAVENYGWIETTVNWDDVNVAENLLKKGQQYLSDIQFEDMVLTVSAIDLHNLNVDYQAINILDSIRVVSEPHGLDRYFPVTKRVIPLNKPSQETFTLGTTVTQSLTSNNHTVNSEILNKIETLPTKSAILKEASDNATQLIHEATHGHVVTTANEQLIMDTDSVETATKVWRWNLGGLGYSSTGYDGEYGTAITMDGGIVGTYITAHSITADKLSVEYTASVEKQITDGVNSALDYTDEALASYYTIAEIKQQLQVGGGVLDSIIAETYATQQSVTSQISQSSDSILLTVSRTYATQESVNGKTSEDDVVSIISQNAESIRLSASKISWESDYSSMTEDGVLTCVDANIQGNLTMNGGNVYAGIGEQTYTWFNYVSGTETSWTGYGFQISYTTNTGEVSSSYSIIPRANGVTKLSQRTSSGGGVGGLDEQIKYTNSSDGVWYTNVLQTNVYTRTIWDHSSTDIDACFTWGSSYFRYGNSSNPTMGSRRLILDSDEWSAYIDADRYVRMVISGSSDVASYYIHLSDTSYLNWTSTQYYLYVASSRYIRLQSGTLNIYASSSVYMRLNSSGLYINGSYATLQSASSKRYKHDISYEIDDSFDPEKLYDLPMVQFVFNDDKLLEGDDLHGKTIPGFIAEDVEKIYPGATRYLDGQVEDWDARRIIPGMLALIQKQHREIEELKERVNNYVA